MLRKDTLGQWVTKDGRFRVRCRYTLENPKGDGYWLWDSVKRKEEPVATLAEAREIIRRRTEGKPKPGRPRKAAR